MRTVTSLAIWVALVLVIHGCKSGVADRNGVTAARRRETALIRRLGYENTDENTLFRLRAAEELGELAQNDARAARDLVKALFARTYYEANVERVLVRNAALSDEVTAAAVLNAYKSVGDVADSQLDCLLIVLARMAGRAKTAVPFLRQELQEPHEPRSEGQIRVALANVGWDSQENIARIEEGLMAVAERREEGGEPVAPEAKPVGQGALMMMAFSTPGKWVTQRIVALLSRCLEVDDVDDGTFAVSALGHLSERARPVLAQLKSHLNAAASNPDRAAKAIACGFAIAEIDPSESAAAMRAVAKCAGSERVDPHGLYAILLLETDQMPEELMRELVILVDDRDEIVATGAAIALSCAGARAHDAVPGLLRIVKSARSQKLRRNAAMALSCVATPADVRALEERAKAEESESIRDVLNEGIKALKGYAY